MPICLTHRALTLTRTAPSYFSRFFEDQLNQNHDVANIRTLYIDRDPTTFREIARHLQGICAFVVRGDGD